MDESVIAEFIPMCSNPKGPVFAAWYWVLDDPAYPGRILIGNGGVLQTDGRPETVVLGYSVLDEFQNHGYTTEAVRALIPAIFSLQGITRIIATTYPELGASIRVLEKSGFARSDLLLSGTGAEEGTVCFVRAKIKTKKV
jgi:RimJ/RimL family protein N-acetyltransferase